MPTVARPAGEQPRVELVEAVLAAPPARRAGRSACAIALRQVGFFKYKYQAVAMPASASQNGSDGEAVQR